MHIFKETSTLTVGNLDDAKGRMERVRTTAFLRGENPGLLWHVRSSRRYRLSL